MTTKENDFLPLPYRPCVGIVVFNKDNKVWVGKRAQVKGKKIKTTDKLWQFPQGGIKKGEKPLEAAKRELYEETGMHSIHLLKEAHDWINYDLPEELISVVWGGKYRGQRQKWFAFLFEGDENEIAINPPPDGNLTEFDKWEWLDLESVPMMVVPFKQHVYEEITAQFKHIIVN